MMLPPSQTLPSRSRSSTCHGRRLDMEMSSTGGLVASPMAARFGLVTIRKSAVLLEMRLTLTSPSFPSSGWLLLTRSLTVKYAICCAITIWQCQFVNWLVHFYEKLHCPSSRVAQSGLAMPQQISSEGCRRIETTFASYIGQMLLRTPARI